MLSPQEATLITKRSLPDGQIQKVIRHEGLYIFQIFTKNVFEEELDPFYSVNCETGDFREFSILTDGNIEKLTALFLATERFVE